MKPLRSRLSVWLAGILTFIAAATLLSAAAAAPPSFDCKTSKRVNERLICRSTELSELDNQMVALYEEILRYLSRGDQEELKQSQQRWWDQRTDCNEDFLCTKRAYTERIERLTIVAGKVSDRRSPSQQPAYTVAKITLGAKVPFDSKEYKQYNCVPSSEFPGLIWCVLQKEEEERQGRGRFNARYEFLHASDGTIVYVNRFQEPAYWDDDEIENDVKWYSKRIGEQAKILKIPVRRGIPDAAIAIWGNVILNPLDNEKRNALADGKQVTGEILIDHIGDPIRSVRQQLPVYRVAGGAGFVWAGSNKDGRGTLRILAINPSLFPQQSPQQTTAPAQTTTPPKSAAPSPTEATYATKGWWTITHKIVGNLNGCLASSRFQDQTTVEMALIQSGADQIGWTIWLSNPRWSDWIATKRRHNLTFDTTRKWEFSLSVNNSNSLWLDPPIDFIRSVADARSLEIFNDRGAQLTSLNLKDSDDAIQSIISCMRDHPYVPQPAPQAKIEPERETDLSGTGFFVAPNWLLTNNHVVKDCRRNIEIKKPDQPSQYAYVNGQDDTNDLALLRTDMTTSSVASFRHKPKVGERVATYGFPYVGLLSSSGNFTSGEVTAPTGMNDDTRFIQISTPIQPGNSGGPLLDMSGNVVGIVVAQLNAAVMMRLGNSIPQNVNFAIGSPIVTNFLSVKGIVPKVAASGAGVFGSMPGGAQADVYEVAKDFTVQISCKGVPQNQSGKNQASSWRN